MKFRNFISIMVIPTILLTLGCSKQGDVYKKMQSLLKKDVNVIGLNDMTSFKWDRVVIGRYDATKTDLESACGNRLDQFVEFKKHIIFILEGKVVHYEQWQVNVEHPTNNEIIFAKEASDRVLIFPSTISFRVSKVPIPGGGYFVLTDI